MYVKDIAAAMLAVINKPLFIQMNPPVLVKEQNNITRLIFNEPKYMNAIFVSTLHILTEKIKVNR